jgi:hypothetical protein
MTSFGRKYVFTVSVGTRVQVIGNGNGKCLVQTGRLVESNINNHLKTGDDPKKTFNGSWPETVCASFRLLLSIAIQLCFISAVVKLFTQRIDRHKQALRAGLEKR